MNTIARAAGPPRHTPPMVSGELSPAETEALLASEHIARIGCHAGGRTYVVPVAYAWHDGALIAHSGEGMKLRMMRENPEVCVEVDRVEDLATWRSVIAWGRFEELRGREADEAMRVLLARFRGPAPPRERGASAEPPRAHAVLYRVHLREMSGRFENSGPWG